MKIVFTFLLVFILADVLIVAYIVYRRFRKRLSQEIIQKIQANWKAIIRNPDHPHAILEADKLLEFALEQMGYRGNLGHKLKKAPTLFSNINGLWNAHKVRNNIAHQINYEVSEAVYKKTMLSFKQAFKDLKIF